MKPSSERSEGFHPFQLLRFLQASVPMVVDHAELTLELAELEWQREKKRLHQVILVTAFGFVSGIFLAAVATAVIILLSWNTPYQTWIIVALLVVYALGVAWALLRLRRLTYTTQHRFAATRAELARDIALLRENT